MTKRITKDGHIRMEILFGKNKSVLKVPVMLTNTTKKPVTLKIKTTGNNPDHLFELGAGNTLTITTDVVIPIIRRMKRGV